MTAPPKRKSMVSEGKRLDDFADRHIEDVFETITAKIAGVLENEANVQEREAFNRFASEMRQELNGGVADAEIVDMLAQHVVTRPAFE